MFDKHPSDAQPRCYIVLDIESAVIDLAGHRRYQAMERWRGDSDDPKSRRGHKPEEDSLKTPRWPFQTIVAVSAMVLFEHRCRVQAGPAAVEGGLGQRRAGCLLARSRSLPVP